MPSCEIFSNSKAMKRTKIKIIVEMRLKKKLTTITIIELVNETQKNIFSIADFPKKITQIDNAYPSLKEKEEIVLHQIIESLKEGR
jgi:hypothetical protein